MAKSDYWWYNHLSHVAKGDFTDQKINRWFLLLHEKYIRKWFYIYDKWFLNKSYDVRYSIHADHETSGYFIDWSLNCWKWLPFGISGPRHGMTLKLSPKKLLDKRWLLMMLLVESSDRFAVTSRFMASDTNRKSIFGILSMLITWQGGYKLLKINIFLKESKFYSCIPTFHVCCLQTVL